jgi:hypothetical protein
MQAFREHDLRTDGTRGYSETQTSDFIERATEDSHPSRTPLYDSVPAPAAMPLHPSFPHIQSSHGTLTTTSVGGDHNVVDSSRHETNTNSGNTTTAVTTDSNNDLSVRVRGRAYTVLFHLAPS